MTLFELLAEWRTAQAYKHDMRDPDGVAERQINALSNYDFLVELSNALDEILAAQKEAP
jgi:hypothetical protein